MKQARDMHDNIKDMEKDGGSKADTDPCITSIYANLRQHLTGLGTQLHQSKFRGGLYPPEGVVLEAKKQAEKLVSGEGDAGGTEMRERKGKRLVPVKRKKVFKGR
jgi:hypothetical protein